MLSGWPFLVCGLDSCLLSSIHRLLLDDLGVTQVAVVIGGSMGGMNVLEWSFFGPSYVRAIVPIATSARHSAWCISWAEAQRQSIACDPKYEDGYYTFSDPPISGLGAARMSALLTYRSRNSFESRFGRNIPDPAKHPYIATVSRPIPSTPKEENWIIHTDGFKTHRQLPSSSSPSSPSIPSSPISQTIHTEEKEISPTIPPGLLPATHSITTATTTLPRPRPPVQKASTFFSAQTYLRYQAEKFVTRFDANCYISITRKLDTHDVSRGRAESIPAALALIQQPALVIGIESDGLFTYAEQQELAERIPKARLATIDSPEGHDAFLLQFQEVGREIRAFLKEVCGEIMEKEGGVKGEEAERWNEVEQLEEGLEVKRTGGVGEVDDITAW